MQQSISNDEEIRLSIFLVNDMPVIPCWGWEIETEPSDVGLQERAQATKSDCPKSISQTTNQLHGTHIQTMLQKSNID